MTDPTPRKTKLIRDNASRRRRMADPAYREAVNARRRQRYANNPLQRQAQLDSNTAWRVEVRETDPVAYAAMASRKNAAAREKYSSDAAHRVAVLTRTGAVLRQKRANPAYRQTESARALASYHDQTPEEKRAQNSRHHQQRRAAKAKAPHLEYVDLDVLFERDKGICQLCYKRCRRSQASNDHIIPLSEGGAHTYQNCVLAHRSCNSQKGNRHNIAQQQRLFG
jgi:5-methylcytosine-specific restriction endonuclease McrA